MINNSSKLQIDPANKSNLRACVWIVSEGLSYIWAKRKAKVQIDMETFTAVMGAKCQLLEKSKFGPDGVNLSALINIINTMQ